MRAGTMGKLHSMDGRGKFGYSGGFGRIAFGYTRLGFYHWLCGIYQKKYYYGKPHISRQRFTWGSNPRTLAQQNWRFVLAYGLVLWRALDSAQKLKYNKRAKGKIMSGYNLFLREWLQYPTVGFGSMLFGYVAL